MLVALLTHSVGLAARNISELFVYSIYIFMVGRFLMNKTP